MNQTNPQIFNPKSGFNSLTKTYHSLRPPLDLPPEDTPLSAAAYALSLQSNSPWPNSVALIDSVTGQNISFTEFSHRIKTLAFHLQNNTKLSKGDTALILTPNSTRVPILYFALLSLGIIISPLNPLSSESEISRQIQLSKPAIAFATSASCQKLPKLRNQTILLDSPEFDSMMLTCSAGEEPGLHVEVIRQSDVAAIMYSSGTTGRFKGVTLTHRNLMAVVATYLSFFQERESPAVLLSPVPYFHMFGFFYCLKSVAMNETAVAMERFDLRKLLQAVQEFRVTHLAVAPPVVVAMAKGDATDGYDLGSLEDIVCGGAPLGKDVIMAFTAKFPAVVLSQGYGLTESTGAASRLFGPEESFHWGSVGRLAAGYEAKIVDPDTGEALPPGKQGELWIRAPTIMKGYVDDPEATSATVVSGGWLRTGDLCYIDEEGFLFVVDRLKELIKYKGYQVAPAELEQLLLSHPEITDAAVIAYPDEEAGQVPMAFVVRQHQSSLSEAEIMDFVAKQVAPYKKIRRVSFVNSIPKSAAGKILRKELRKIVVSESLSRL